MAKTRQCAMDAEEMPQKALRGLVWIAIAIWVCSGSAQDPRYLSHQAWGMEEGLPQNSVHAIAQTPDGFLWVATEGGLARFDGVGFKIFGHVSGYAAFLSDDLCCLKVETDGALLIGTADGTLRMRGYVGPIERVTDPVFERSVPNPAGWGWSVNGVRHAGREWRVGKDLSGRVQALLVDRAGVGWVGMRNGLAVVDAASGRVTEVKALKGDSVLSLFEDVEGNHWVGTETSGLHVLRRLKFRSEPALAALAVTSVVQAADGAMWIGTRDDGVRRVLQGVVSEPVPVERLSSAVVLSLAPAGDGAVWVGTPDGLNLVSAKGAVRKITSADGLPDDYVRTLAAGHDDEVWVGTGHGLALVRSGRVERVWTAQDGLASDVVGTILVDESAVWVGTSAGLSCLKGNGTIESFGNGRGLTGTIVTAMARDRNGTLWVVSSAGNLKRFDGKQFIPSWVTLWRPQNDEIADRPIEGMTADAAGNLWIRLDRGIQRISAEQLARCESGSCSGGVPLRYGRADGLPSDETVSGGAGAGGAAGWLASDGEIWFPTRHGVGVVDTENLPVDGVPPPVAIENFWVDGEPGGAVGPDARIPFGNRRFSFEYAGLSFTAPSEVRYSYRLEGFDPYWIDAGTRRSATYTNLPPGEYVFRVTAVNGDGVENHAGATLRFRVVPPFYLRWWFVSLMVLAVMAVLAGLYWLRLRRMQRDFDVRLAERNRMAREIHDTLTQDFVGASLQLDIVAQQLKRGEVVAALEQVARTRRLVSEGLDEARRSIWELRDGGSGEGLPARLTLLAGRAAMPVAVQVGGAYRVLAQEVEREVLRIAQEALKNIERHARATEVSVNLHYSDEAVLITIEDNGVGFRIENSASKAGHFGLLGMRERAVGIGGDLKVASEPGGGTKVTLRVPS
jgi:signal transduction histidine kinase/ligand-binding sensor domain-containing protein